MNKAYSFDDITMLPCFNSISSRKDVDTSFKFKDLVYSTPIVSANMDTITGTDMAVAMANLGGIGILHRFCSIKDNVKMFRNAIETAYCDGFILTDSIGVSVCINEGLDRAKALYEAGATIFCVDVAHAHSEACGNMVKLLRSEFPSITIIAGNICSGHAAQYLATCGADIIKIGIGSGGVCSTRIKTGFGIPQFSAIQECASMCALPIISDGGCRNSGDIMKALGAGASMVMLGSMLAGTDETPGDIIESETYPKDLKECKVFRGMASLDAQSDMFGSMPEWKTAEGISTIVECKGPVENIIKDIMGGIRSGMTYAGASTLDEFRRKVEFVEITNAGRIEGTPHIKS